MRVRREFVDDAGRLFRFLATILIVVFVSFLVNDARVVEAERRGCDRRQEIFRTAILEPLRESIHQQRREIRVETVPRERSHEVRTLRALQRRERVVAKNIVEDCDDAYPRVVPLLG